MSVNKPKHHATVMNFFGNPVPGWKLDLFREVKQMENCFLVDTNMPWEAYSVLPQFRNSAFIIGPTLLRERTLRNIFENKNGHKVRKNVYVFGLFPSAREGGILRLSLERVDENFHVFRPKNDIYYNKPEYRLEDFSPEDGRKAEAQKILSLLEAGSVSDLKNYELRMNAKNRLLPRVASEAKACFRDYYKCVKAVEMAYAVLLTEEKTALNEFEQLRPNIFNDAELVHNALFFGATLLSANYKHVGKMAEYCGLAFRQELD